MVRIKSVLNYCTAPVSITLELIVITIQDIYLWHEIHISETKIYRIWNAKENKKKIRNQIKTISLIFYAAETWYWTEGNFCMVNFCNIYMYKSAHVWVNFQGKNVKNYESTVVMFCITLFETVCVVIMVITKFT